MKIKPKKKIRILIIEDNRLLRDGISAMINKQPDLKVAASISEKEYSSSDIFNFKLDLVLMSNGFELQNSLNIVKSIKKKSSVIKIIVMDLMPAQSDIPEFEKAGVSGFIVKDAVVQVFLKTIRSVAAGKKVLPPHLADSLFSRTSERLVNNKQNADAAEAVRMTIREQQIIELIADGLTNKEIGQTLHLSPYTIKSHVHNILEKMTVNTRLQIAKYAISSNKFKD